jgi:hypothetical protein
MLTGMAVTSIVVEIWMYLRPGIVLTGGSLMTDGRVTQNFRKENMRSNNSDDGN